jgi:hypothetical protein
MTNAKARAAADAALNDLETEEVSRAEGWTERAAKIAADRAALEAEMTENAPRTAKGVGAMKAVHQALRGGSAIDRIRARRAERAAG